MIDITFDKAKWITDSDGTWLMLQTSNVVTAKDFCSKKKDKRYVAKIKEYNEHRSLDANAYLWVLCDKMANILHTTKEDIYIEAIKRVGQFQFLPVRDDAVDTFIKRWKANGLGWIAETINGSKFDGYTRVIAYFGSSVYDKKEMSVLIDEVVYEAKKLGIETYTPEQLAALTERWGNEKADKST